MRKRSTPLGPGGKLILGGLGGLVGFFLIWQFVLPFFFGSATPSAASGNTTTQNSSNNTSVDNSRPPELEGTVVNATTGLPLAQASIKKADGTELVKTDDKGQFAIAKLPADKDKLTVSASGFEAVPLPLTPDAAKAIQLKPRVITGTVLDKDSQQPLAGKLVRGGDSAIVTDDAGKFSFTGLADGSKIKVALIGYEEADQVVDATTPANLTISIQSTSFSGSLTDTKSGKPIPNAVVKTDDQMVISGEDGKFSFSDLKHDDNTVLKVRAPGYKIQSFKAADLAKGVKMEPFMTRAIYVPGILAIRANYDDLFAGYWKMADQGQINTIVLGIKNDDDGLLWYDSQVPLAKQLGLVKDQGKNADVLLDIPKILAEAKKHNVYMVARYVVMRDPGLAGAKPEWAIKSIKTGGSWHDDNKLSWPNPFQPEVAEYNAALAKELSDLGFNEVQYDYIRFPTDGTLKDIRYKPELTWTQLNDNEKLRESTIDAVVKKAYDTLRPTDTFLSLDVFGVSLWREDDNNIGQQYNDLMMISDYICPMVYPSHFDPGTLDEKQYPGHPGLYPGVIIEKSGIIANKLEAKFKPVAKYRPWLEDFSKTWGTPTIKNTPARVMAQIDAAEKNGSWGWTLWNATGEYTTSVLSATAKTNRP